MPGILGPRACRGNGLRRGARERPGRAGGRSSPWRPLPARNALSARPTPVAYLHATGDKIDAPYGALIDLACDVGSGRADAYAATDRIRSRRI